MPSTLAHPASPGSLGPASARMQKNCPSCGFLNLGVDLRCQKCGRRLPEPVAAPAPASAQNIVEPPAVPLPARPAMPEHVRSEIHSRVERFKARRRGQTLPLPFEEPVLAQEENVVPFPTLESDPPARTPRTRANREARTAAQSVAAAGVSNPIAVEIPAAAAVPAAEAPAAATPAPSEPSAAAPPAAMATEVTAAPANPAAAAPASPAAAAPVSPAGPAPQFPLFIPPSEQAQPEWENFQIAAIQKRLSGIGRDLACLLWGVLLFAAPFYWIAGRPQINLRLLAGFMVGSLLIALLYGSLFLVVFGETPGMTAAGLRIVSFNGQQPTVPQRLLRVAGALVSCGSFLFGYLWAFVDEEKLYWHDHISKTVLTDSRQ